MDRVLSKESQEKRFVGINDTALKIRGKCNGIQNKILRSYSTWYNIMVRLNENIAYSDCSICVEWLLFSNFNKWHDENYIDGFELDKDILIEDNRIYSPDTCAFVPKRINNLFNNGKGNSNINGLPRGVARHGNKSYRCVCSTHRGKNRATIEEARLDYTSHVKHKIREIALNHYIEGLISDRVFVALMKRRVK